MVLNHTTGRMDIHERISKLQTLKEAMQRKTPANAWNIAVNIATQALREPRYFSVPSAQFSLLEKVDNSDLPLISKLIPEIVKLDFFEMVLDKAQREVLRQASFGMQLGSSLVTMLKSYKGSSSISGWVYFVAS